MIDKIKNKIKTFDVNNLSIKDLLFLFRLCKEMEEYEYLLKVRKDFDYYKVKVSTLDKEDYD